MKTDFSKGQVLLNFEDDKERLETGINLQFAREKLQEERKWMSEALISGTGFEEEEGDDPIPELEKVISDLEEIEKACMNRKKR